jgi:hypothetical protein
MKARTAMREQRDLEDLLKQEKSTPMDDSETSSDKSSSDKSLIPMGNDDVSLSTEAELSILEKKKMKLSNSKQNIPKLDALEESNEDQESSHPLSNSLRHSSKSKVQLSHSIDPEPGRPLSNSLRHSSKSKVQLSRSMKKPIRRGGSSDSLKSSSKSYTKLSNSMTKSLRRGGSHDSLRSSAKYQANLSSSMKQSIRNAGLDESERSSNTRGDRRAQTRRKNYSKSVINLASRDHPEHDNLRNVHSHSDLQSVRTKR